MSKKTDSKHLPLYGEVFDVIEGERKYQDNLNENVMTVGEELLLLQEYLDRARRVYSDSFGDPHEPDTMHVVRKIAVRCMQNHGALDRK